MFNMLLQVMEEGRLTDSFGRHVDFRNAILIMTTNAGAEAIKNESDFGFRKAGDDASYDSMKERVTERIEKVFRPEFLNRLDDLIIFRHLNKDDLKHVIDIELSKVRKRLGERGLKLVLTDGAKEFVIRRGSNLDFGARPLRREIEQRIEDPLSEELLKGEFKGKDTIVVDVKKDDEGKVKHLIFNGVIGEPELVGAAAASDAAADDADDDSPEPAGEGP